MYYYHVAFQSYDQGEHIGREMLFLTEKITSSNYDNCLKVMETVLKNKYGYESVITHFQLLEDV